MGISYPFPAQAAFVRFKGLDERVVEVQEHVDVPLTFYDVREAVRRARLDRGPFGVRQNETRLMFELLAMGFDGGHLAPGAEDRVSRDCGAVFATHAPADPTLTCPYAALAAFFETTVFCVHRTVSGPIALPRPPPDAQTTADIADVGDDAQAGDEPAAFRTADATVKRLDKTFSQEPRRPSRGTGGTPTTPWPGQRTGYHRHAVVPSLHGLHMFMVMPSSGNASTSPSTISD